MFSIKIVQCSQMFMKKKKPAEGATWQCVTFPRRPTMTRPCTLSVYTVESVPARVLESNTSSHVLLRKPKQMTMHKMFKIWIHLGVQHAKHTIKITIFWRLCRGLTCCHHLQMICVWLRQLLLCCDILAAVFNTTGCFCFGLTLMCQQHRGQMGKWHSCYVS